MAPMSVSMKTVVLFADISGFTVMTKALSLKGPKGAEQIVKNLNTYLEQGVKEIICAGGDIIKFAGDAIIAIWPPKLRSTLAEQDKLLKKNAWSACRCALAIQQNIGTFIIDQVTLRIKLGIGCGDAMMLHLGGVLTRMEAVGVGPAFTEAFGCEEECTAGDVVISKTAYFLLRGVVEVSEPKKRTKSSGNKLLINCKGIRKQSTLKMGEHSSPLMERLQCYIPSAIIPHLMANETKWARELRRTANLFMSIDFKLSAFTSQEVLDEKTETFITRLHNIIRTVQECVYIYEGSLNKFLFDDKGATIYALFGLPPVAHANDPLRAVMSGLALLDRLQNEHDTNIWIGCTTGRVYTGLIGSVGSRWEYSAIGNQVNLSARLAMQAKKNKDLPNILCDKSVFDEVKEEKRVILNAEQPQKLKGFDKEVEVYSISRNPSFEDTEIINHKFDEKLLIGKECEKLRNNLKNLEEIMKPIIKSKPVKPSSESGGGWSRRRRQYGAVFVVEAEIGLAKTQFLRIVSCKYRKHVIFVWGQGDCFHQATGMPVWQQILNRLLLKYPRENTLFKKILGQYIKQRRPKLLDLFFLVNDLFFPTNPLPVNRKIIDEMSDGALSNARWDIMFLFIEMIAWKKPVIIVIDECQHLVKEDWDITRRFCYLIRHRRLSRITVLIGSPPIHKECYKPIFSPKELGEEYMQLRGEQKEFIISPAPWDILTTETYTKRALVVDSVKPSMVEVIFEKCGGRPDLIKKFVASIKDFGEGTLYEKKKDEQNSLTAMWCDHVESKLEEGIDVIEIPPFIWHSTVALLDHLKPEQSILLKTAAVICTGQGQGSTRFSKYMLIRAHPIKELKPKIGAALERLCDWGFLKKSTKPEDEHILFGNIIPRTSDLLKQSPDMLNK